ncbi:MAG: DUF6044 family protein [Candidatus Omnitrophota bacterium]
MLRTSIAYTNAVVLLVGVLFILIRTIFAKRVQPEIKKVTNVTKDPVSKDQSNKPKNKPKNKQSTVFYVVSILIVLAFWAPYLFRGEDVHVKIFDNMDCHVPQTKVLAESGKAFSLDPHTKLDNFINGLALSGVDSGYNVMTWLFMILPAFWAYALNELLVRLIALLGMIWLLRKYIIQDKTGEYNFITFGAAVCFALLPFYPAGGISVAGIPLLLTAFLNIRNRESTLTDFLIILAFPFYSKLALAGFFIAVTLFVLFVVDWITKRKINFPYLGGLALLTVTYCFTHFHLLYSFLDPYFVSFREEISAMGLNTAKALRETVHNFIFDRVNEVGAHHIFVLGAAALAAILTVFKKTKDAERNIRLMAGLVMMCLVTAFMWGFKYWSGMIPLREKYQLLNAFDFSRFYWLNPFLWYVIFALALLGISRIKFGKYIALFFIVGQVAFMFMNYNWEYRSMIGFRHSFAGSPLTYSLTYRQFVSESLFRAIDEFIHCPKKDYRVISLGIHPGVAQYNGFYTLDIYTDIYPLEYKHRFQKIFEKELAKSEELQRGFGSNAKRCFLMAAELHGDKEIRGLMFTRGITKAERNLRIKHLDLNTPALKELGGKYIFSAVPIDNYAENGLSVEGIFKQSDSPWKIYLYKVN